MKGSREAGAHILTRTGIGEYLFARFEPFFTQRSVFLTIVEQAAH
jgi:hypothetical protein